MSDFVPDDGLALLDGWISAGTMMTKFVSYHQISNIRHTKLKT